MGPVLHGRTRGAGRRLPGGCARPGERAAPLTSSSFCQCPAALLGSAYTGNCGGGQHGRGELGPGGYDRARGRRAARRGGVGLRERAGMSKHSGDFPKGVPEDLRRPAMPLGHFALIMARRARDLGEPRLAGVRVGVGFVASLGEELRVLAFVCTAGRTGGLRRRLQASGARPRGAARVRSGRSGDPRPRRRHDRGRRRSNADRESRLCGARRGRRSGHRGDAPLGCDGTAALLPENGSRGW
jgi:hypothetical protein